jgi:NADH dehydrogenase/NADH:ubiquinone oxidoreductase subunit G
MFYNQIYDKYFHLPTTMFYENNETFISTEGLIKRTTKLVSKGKVKNNWQILRKCLNI